MRIADPIRLYDGAAPGSEDWTNVERQYWSELWATEVVVNVVEPTITPVLATGEPNGTAVVIAPGGGFYALSIESEGFAVANRLAAEGITSFVLKYRLVPGGEEPIGEMMERAAIDLNDVLAQMADIAPLGGADGQAAMRLVRQRSADFGVDPKRVGFMGFSAGGNVALRSAYSSDPEVLPNFVAAVYPTTRGIEVAAPPDGSGPMFLTVATDDTLGLTTDSIALYEQWRTARVPVELHAYAQGGHGYGMRTQDLPSDRWIERFVEWLTATSL